MEAAVFITEAAVFDARAQFVEEIEAVFGRRLRQDQHEFLAADPAQNIAFSNLIAQMGRNRLEDLVARGVAISVVYFLE